LPLSPDRQWARCCSFTLMSILVDVDRLPSAEFLDRD
jgi:hypothetical protein